jgi:pimeloyl-ACP methyl ester carboxylesterase
VAADGVPLSGWFISSSPERAPLLIYFGGNAEDVSWLVGMADRFAGHSLLLVNYRGYGGSGGRPGESALFADALLAYDYAKQRGDVDASRIVAMGRSLGSGVAVHLAAHRPLAGMILVSPYDSVRALAQSIYPWLPVRLLLRHPFDSLSRAGALAVPLLCLVAGNDGVIPPAHSRRLFDAWGGRDKRWVEVPGAGHDEVSGEPVYWDEIASFLGRFSRTLR